MYSGSRTVTSPQGQQRRQNARSVASEGVMYLGERPSLHAMQAA
jgi:hypothetical protein